MIYLCATSIAAIAALLYLLVAAHRQIDDLLNRIQAPELVVQRTILDNGAKHDPELVPVDMGPWTHPQQEEEDNAI